MKKFLGFLFAACVTATALTSCLNDDDPYSAGFTFGWPVPGYYNIIYANTVSDSLVFASYGPWRIDCNDPTASWCTIPTLSGQGGLVFRMPVTFQQNTTGTARSVSFTITDTDHPSEASGRWGYLQTATRGDGSMGNAALVKGITASDGRTIQFQYDTQNRPVKLVMAEADNTVLSELEVKYNDRDSLLQVTMDNRTMRGTMDRAFQADRLTGDADTVGYYSISYGYGQTYSYSYAFNFEHRQQGGFYQGLTYKLGGQSLLPDSIHNVDSLFYGSLTARGYSVAEMKLEYSQADNRCQSVDVNQLLLGMDHCHPMLLLSMFRYVRNSNIISAARSSIGDITVSTTLNADKSVNTMTVKDARWGGTEVTYSFTY